MVVVMTPSLPVTVRAPDAAGAGPPVDLYDSLAGAGADRGRRILGTLKILVGGQDDRTARVGRVEAPVPSPDDLPLASVISGAVQDRAERPWRRRDQWPPDAGVPVTRFAAADARPNLLVRGEAFSSVPTQLLRWWAPGRHDCVIIDIDGRYARIDLPAPDGRHVDVAHVSMDQLREVLRGRSGVSVLDFSHVPAAVGSTTLARVLSVVAVHRTRTGHPHWLMIDGAETVLSDPGIPPQVLDLSRRGHCLVMRSTEGLPDSLAASIDIVVGSGCSAGG
jgi:hypothetical protein